MSKWIFPAVALCLVLFVMPVVAEPPEEAGTEPTEAVVSEGQESQEASIQSVCTAECQHGPDQTCRGSSCFAVDQDCPSERGYCWGSDTGTKYCQECLPPERPDCFAKVGCSPGIVFCMGDICAELDDCWVECDGVQTWCPNPGPGCFP